MEKQLKEAIQILDLSAHSELHSLRVYLLDVEYVPSEVMAYLASTLSLKEKRKAVRFRREEDRQVYVGGRGLLRVLIGECLDLLPSEINLREERYGKPYLSGYKDTFQFNLSNSGSKVAIVVNPAGNAVGIDMEMIDPAFEYWEIAAHYFTTNECDRIYSHKDFYKYWTKKEALLKVTGVGLVDDLNRLDMSKEINFLEAKDERLADFKNEKYTLYTFNNEELILTLAVGDSHPRYVHTQPRNTEVEVCNVYIF